MDARFSPDGKTIATASSDVTIKFWDAATGKEQATLEAHGDAVTAVAYSPDGTVFATASFDGTAKVWDANTRKLLQTLRGHKGAVMTVAVDPDGKHIATGGIDGTVRIWDAETGKESRWMSAHKSWVNAVTYSPDGHRLATVSSDNEVRIRDNYGKEWVVIRPRLAEIRSVAFSPDSKLVAVGTRYGVVQVWKTSFGADVVTLKAHAADVYAVAFSPDGKTLATGNGDWNKPGDIKLWDTTTWKERGALKHTGEVMSLAFHPKKPILAAGAWDRTAMVWDLTELLKVEK